MKPAILNPPKLNFAKPHGIRITTDPSTKTNYMKKRQKNLQEKSVINLSNKSLSKTTLTTLSKGLTFSPTPKPTKYQQIYTSFLKYRKNMYNRYHFRHTQPKEKHPFKLPTKFTASFSDNSNLQEYISNVLHDLKTVYTDSRQSTSKNLTTEELHSIQTLKIDTELIVKPADKGGAIVIWPKALILLKHIDN